MPETPVGSSTNTRQSQEYPRLEGHVTLPPHLSSGLAQTLPSKFVSAGQTLTPSRNIQPQFGPVLTGFESGTSTAPQYRPIPTAFKVKYSYVRPPHSARYRRHASGQPL